MMRCAKPNGAVPRQGLGWPAVSAGACWVALLCAAACGGNNTAFDPEELPPNLKEPYETFAFHCSRCHTLTRPLTAHIESTIHWDRYVARMRRMPGSGIGADDERVILRFLYYYTQEIRGFDDPISGEETSGGENTIDGSTGLPASDEGIESEGAELGTTGAGPAEGE